MVLLGLLDERHLQQQLRKQAPRLSVVIGSATSRRDGVKLIEEDDGRLPRAIATSRLFLPLLCGVENLSEQALALAGVLAENIARTD